MDGLAEDGIDGLPLSLAVTVALPAVLKVTLRVFVPATSAVLPGTVALVSVELIATMSLVLTTFQLASTALTVTLKAVPAVWAAGVPVLPVVVPGAGVAPGTNNCSFTKPARSEEHTSELQSRENLVCR